MRPLLRALKLHPKPLRHIHTTANRRSMNVHPSLLAMRVQTPWLEALQAKNEGRPLGPTGKDNANFKASPVIDGKIQPKRMSDSFTSIVNEWLVDSYVNASGRLRMGQLFMDMDALAGVIAYKHTGPATTNVTAACDRISILHSPNQFCDLEMSGQVTWTSGRSSMEVSLQVVEKESKKKMITCAMTMVALDPKTKKAMNIAPLVIENSEEQKLFDKAEEYNRSKKEIAQQSLEKQTPNDEESDLIHEMYLQQQTFQDQQSNVKKPDDMIYMDETVVESTQIMQPQYRNRHSYQIFGGHLLCQTFELAFCCAAAFSHSRPSFLSLDPSTFKQPVPVGSVLYLTARVAFTEPSATAVTTPASSSSSTTTPRLPSTGSRIHVRVDSKVRDVEHGSVQDAGTFIYSFYSNTKIEVMPRTYEEFVLYLDARRRAGRGKKWDELALGEVTKGVGVVQ